MFKYLTITSKHGQESWLVPDYNIIAAYIATITAAITVATIAGISDAIFITAVAATAADALAALGFTRSNGAPINGHTGKGSVKPTHWVREIRPNLHW